MLRSIVTEGTYLDAACTLLHTNNMQWLGRTGCIYQQVQTQQLYLVQKVEDIHERIFAVETHASLLWSTLQNKQQSHNLALSSTCLWPQIGLFMPGRLPALPALHQYY